MPAVPARRLVAAVTDAFLDSGGSAVLVSAIDRNPRKFAVTVDERGLVVWIYLWTVTPGGRKALPHELRIQMTAVEAPLEANPDGPTLLMGYEPTRDVFAGFDFQRHRNFTPGSPSIQVHQDVLTNAATQGIAFGRRGSGDIVVGIRPDMILFYAEHARTLHTRGGDEETIPILERVAAGERVTKREIEQLPGPRRRLVITVERYQRSSTFKESVLRAYDHRCAVTGAQLKLVEAAHVLPVAAPGSTDEVSNGLALSPTYHRAFDAGLFYIDADHVTHVNEARVEQLRTLERAGGLEAFVEPLGAKILLPPSREQWPKPEFIEAANRFRRVRQ